MKTQETLQDRTEKTIFINFTRTRRAQWSDYRRYGF